MQQVLLSVKAREKVIFQKSAQKQVFSRSSEKDALQKKLTVFERFEDSVLFLKKIMAR